MNDANDPNAIQPNAQGTRASRQLLIEERRRQVAALRRRGLSIRQISEALARAGFTNPKTDRSWGLATIQADLDFLTETARADAMRDVSEHKAEVLSDYRELLTLAWREKRYEDVRKVLRDIRDLLGTDAPQVIVFEQMEQRMTEAVAALEVAFSDDPGSLSRALDALMGVSDQGASSLN